MAAILKQGVEKHASDVHVHAGAILRMRIGADYLEVGDSPIERQRSNDMLVSILSESQRAIFEEAGELDLAYSLEGVSRFRVNMYRQQRGTDAVFRVVPSNPPSLEDLSLPNELAGLTNFHQGMVLITGSVGCGKSSTLAALVNLINEERSEHILTVEDPIEYLHPSKRCLVNQRQVLLHTQTFGASLRAALREDPDVIVIGELRDYETISLALTAAETGHFVLGTLHTNSTIRTVNRLIGVFPPDQQGQVRTMLSEALKAVISQRMVDKKDGSGRVPAIEKLMITKPVGNLIRENKTFQLASLLQTGKSQGMWLMDQYLEGLVKKGTISKEEALRVCENPKSFNG
ncbi:MAG: type IV pilus twitching motility protein PilT [Deltaproteobacteria bacterium]|nr:type IV pilus twitching motility protein PilT [Deltaproteobacteria bacterium]